MGGGNDEVIVPVYESGAEVLQKLQEKCSRNSGRSSYPAAMYSSVVGGIILDPAMMSLPIDDHMVHRGHGVFDTAMLLDGCLYELDAHLDRFLRSAAKARIDTAPFPRHALRAILIQMTAASGCRRGSIRYWLSAGPGDFLLSSAGCPAPALYAVVIAADYDQCRHGVRAVTSTVPMKPPLFATAKNVNYHPSLRYKPWKLCSNGVLLRPLCRAEASGERSSRLCNGGVGRWSSWPYGMAPDEGVKIQPRCEKAPVRVVAPSHG